MCFFVHLCTFQEENDWLRSVLRLAEAHIKHEKEELKSLHSILDRNKTDSEQRFLALEARMRATGMSSASEFFSLVWTCVGHITSTMRDLVAPKSVLPHFKTPTHESWGAREPK